MKKKYTMLSLSIAFLTNSVLAGTMSDLPTPRTWTWIGSFSAGPVWWNGTRNQRLFLTPEIEKAYTDKKANHTLGLAELFLGLQKSINEQWQGQIGLAAATTENTRFKGTIWDDANPEFNNYVYKYKVNHSRLTLKGKLLMDRGYWFIPWISAGVGVAFHYAHNFENKPTIFEALPNSNFTNHTQKSFAYTLGAGVQKPLNQHWQIGIGYEFADWDKSRLGRAEGQTLNNGLELKHFYTNGVLLNLTYLA